MDKGRIPEFDGLRGIAALGVLLFHFSPYTGPLRWLRPVADFGWVGVDLFFVLSGFLITNILLQSLGSSGYYRDFFIRRVFRTFPLYYAVLGLYTLSLYLADQEAWTHVQAWGSPVWFALYLGNIRASVINDFPPVDGYLPLWSLQIEEQFYALFPFVVIACRPAALGRVLGAAIVLALGCRIGLTVLAPDYMLASWWLPTARCDGLALGALLAAARHHGAVPFAPRTFALMAAVGASTFAALCLVRGTIEIEDPLIRTVGFSCVDVTFACVLAAVTGSLGTTATAALRSHVLAYLSRLSYGLYLMHLPASEIVRAVARPFIAIEPHDSLNLPLSFGLSIVLAALSWRFFESPVLRLRDRLSRATPVAALPAAPRTEPRPAVVM
jgi:peptidoglycan/LPS O-acetylase OafA/YrhL